MHQLCLLISCVFLLSLSVHPSYSMMMRSKVFSVKDNHMIISGTKKEIPRISSPCHCASVCNVDDECCSALYSYGNKTCTLVDCCYVSTEPVTGVMAMYKMTNIHVDNAKDCRELGPQYETGVYTIYPDYTSPMEVYCDMETDCGGWTVIQKRVNGIGNFFRDWESYKTGFGDKHADFWLGNENIHKLTSQLNYSLRIELEDFEGNRSYAFYTDFLVGNVSTDFRLIVSGYSGDAGDGLTGRIDVNGVGFSTFDKDNDKSSMNCASSKKGGWWYGACSVANLNGIYQQGSSKGVNVNWSSWKGYESLKMTMMMIRPRII